MNNRLLIGRHPTKGLLFAAIDPAARHVLPAVRDSKLAAWLAPFSNRDLAIAALKASGAEVQS